MVIIVFVSRLRRLVLSGRFFFVTCRLLAKRHVLSQVEFACLARVVHERRQEHGFLLTAWVFLPDHWHAILFPRHPLTISEVMESIKVSSRRRINRGPKESGGLWQGRFFDRAVRTVQEYQEKVKYIHENPLKAGPVTRPGDWRWSSVNDYTGSVNMPAATTRILAIDRVLLPSDGRTRI